MKKFLLLLALLLGLGVLYASGVLEHLSLERLKIGQAHWQARAQAAPLLYGGLFFGIYVAITSLALPGAAVLTLAGGAIFGFWRGLLLVSFASSVGASLSFLLARYFFRDWLWQRFHKIFFQIDRGFQRDGVSFLVLLRLVPLFPFFLVNLAVGVTSISLGKFYLLSQAAMLPGTVVYVNAGTELGKVRQLSDILSPSLLVACSLLGVFPFVAKKAVAYWKRRRLC